MLIQLKNTNDPGRAPTLNQLEVGELAVNTYDGDIYLKKVQDSYEEILRFSSDVPVENVFYVQKNGSNSNDGKSWNNAFLSIEKALEVAERRDGEITLIEIAPGTYETQGHLDVPDNCLIHASYRSVIIRPSSGYEERNVFRLGSGSFLEGPVFEDWRLDSLENPTEGFAVCFRPGALITRTPYAHKIAVRTNPYWGQVAPPLDRDNGNPLVGRGAGVIIADGSVCSPYSVYPNFMTWGATPVTHNGIGYVAKNGAMINAVNAIGIWCHKHFLAQSGGQIVLSGCSTQFGDFTLVSEGSRNIVSPYTLEELDNPVDVENYSTSQADSDLIESSQETIVDDLWANLISEGYVANTSYYTVPDYSEKCSRDAGYILDSVKRDVVTGSNYNSIFAGLAYTSGTVSTNKVLNDQLEKTIDGFTFLKEEVAKLLTGNALSRSNSSFDEIFDIMKNGRNSADAYNFGTASVGTNETNARIGLQLNRTFLQSEIKAWVEENYSENVYVDSNKCFRDAGYLIDAISFDIQHGSNCATQDVIRLYFENSLSVLPEDQRSPTASSWLRLGSVAESVLLKNTVLKTSGNNIDQITDGFTQTSSDVAQRVQDLFSLISSIILGNSLELLPGLVDPDYDSVTATGYDSEFVSAFNSIDSSKTALQGQVVPYLEIYRYLLRDMSDLIRVMYWFIESGDQGPVVDFSKVLFNFSGQKIYNTNQLNLWKYSMVYVRDEIKALAISAGSSSSVSSIVEAIINTVDNTRVTVEPSTITAIGHTWSSIMSGVALTKIPPAANQTSILESILEVNGGQVIASGQDDQGSALFVGGMQINSDTGELSGPPFETAVNRVATRASIARSF